MNLYRPATDPKYQWDEPPAPDGQSADVVISPDTRRNHRLPDGQHRTPKWPVLHASTVPQINPDEWQLTIDGLVDRRILLSLEDFRQLPRVKVFADFHCVTTWSRLGNLWEGVSIADLLQQAGVAETARYAVVHGYDGGWTTNLPLSELRHADVLLADTHDGLSLDADHGGPVRLVVPRLFAWKSAKWVRRIELVESDRRGYWEQLGYHDLGDPWQGQRRR
ncbi:MAG: sulfite oxidase-like oxidoreductase [Fuerstiella sp.]